MLRWTDDGNDEIVPASVEDEDEGALEMMTYHSEENGEHHTCSPTPGSDEEVVLVSAVSDETDRVHQNVIDLSDENGEHLTEPTKTCDIENAVPDSMDNFSRILHSSDSVLSVHEQKTVLKEKIYELQSLVDAARNSDALCTAKQHIVTAINSLKAMESHAHENSNTFPIRKRPASNAKSEKQLRFYSTKSDTKAMGKTNSRRKADVLSDTCACRSKALWDMSYRG